MKRFVTAGLLSAALALPGLSAQAAATPDKRIALVIGNSAYRTAPLTNPLNDARAVSDSLRKLGFKVIALENASQKQMFDAVRQFGDQIQGGVGLFYYAGHGVQVKGRNFLVPVDAQIEREDEVAYKAFDISQVLEKMESARNPLNIVILDACRNNPFARASRSTATGLAQMDAPTGSIVAFATAPGAEANDGSEGNGLYTSYLLKNMNSPGLKVEDVFKRTRVAVRQASDGRQIPWESTSLEGDFYFAAGSAPVGNAAPLPPDLDHEMWLLVAESGKPSAYRAYLDKFPNGQHAAQARSMAVEASAKPQQVAAAKPANTRSAGGFSFSEEEAKMDRATPAGRELAFERTLATLNCAPSRRNARVQLQLSEPQGGLFSVALGERLRQAGMKVGAAGDYVIQGTVSAQANKNRMLRVNEVSLNTVLTLSDKSGRQLASAIGRDESFAGGNVDSAYQELAQVQASEAAGRLLTQLCQN